MQSYLLIQGPPSMRAPHAKIYQTTKRKKNIYIIDLLNAFQVYLDDWIWPIISLPRKYKGGHPTKGTQKKLWFSEVFGTFGENCCFLEWVGILSQQGGSLEFLVKIIVFRNKLGFCPNPLADFHQRRFSVIISMLTKTKNLREEGERGVSLFIVDDFGD